MIDISDYMEIFKDSVKEYVLEGRETTFIGNKIDDSISFFGIPYANVEHRFDLPKTRKLPSLVYAREKENVCPQRGQKDQHQSYRCQFLNIWTKEKNKKKPVLFFVHGGSFMNGSGNMIHYDGMNIVNNMDVVFVNINYRIGPLGFMNFDQYLDDFNYNCGVEDVIMGLEWVYNNIEDFGGDKDNITIYGGSSGGSICSVLPTIDKAKPYISKVILSGAIPAAFWDLEKSREISKNFVDYIDNKYKQNLLYVSDEKMADYAYEFIQNNDYGVSTFAPTIDKKLIKDFPIASIHKKDLRKIPFLIGSTGDEMSILSHKIIMKQWGMDRYISKSTQGEDPLLFLQLDKMYETIYGKNNATQKYSDMIIRFNLSWYAEELIDYTDVYLYRFDYKAMIPSLIGLDAYHSTDVTCLFSNYNEGNTRMMDIIPIDKENLKYINHVVSKDIKKFLYSGQTNWNKADKEDLRAKVYDVNMDFDPFMPRPIRDLWKKTNFYKDYFKE